MRAARTLVVTVLAVVVLDIPWVALALAEGRVPLLLGNSRPLWASRPRS